MLGLFLYMQCTLSSTSLHISVPSAFRIVEDDLRKLLVGKTFEFYGSAVTGVITPDSDIDVAIHGENILFPMEGPTHFLWKPSTFLRVDFVYTSQFKLIRCRHVETNINVDFKELMRTEKDFSKEIASFLDESMQSGLREFLCNVKQSSKRVFPIKEHSRKNSDFGSINNFALTMLAICYWKQNNPKNIARFFQWLQALLLEPIQIHLTFEKNEPMFHFTSIDDVFSFTRDGDISGNNMFKNLNDANNRIIISTKIFDLSGNYIDAMKNYRKLSNRNTADIYLLPLYKRLQGNVIYAMEFYKTAIHLNTTCKKWRILFGEGLLDCASAILLESGRTFRHAFLLDDHPLMENLMSDPIVQQARKIFLKKGWIWYRSLMSLENTQK